MIKTKEKVNSQSENNLKSEPLSSKLKVGSIYALKWDVETEIEILCEGTPLKVLSIDETNKTVECEDYRGKSHFIKSQSLSADEEIKKYPNPFKILLWKINNYLSGDTLFHLARAGAIIFFCIGVSCFFIFNNSSLDNATENITLSAMTISALFIILCWLDIPIFKNLLFIKENLKELKILFNKKGAKAGSEAFTNDKGESL